MKSLLPAVILALAVTPAAAQEAIDFSGVYLDLSVNRASSGSFDSATDVDATANGVAVGAGYLFDIGEFVLGGELTYRRNNYSGINQTTATAIDGTTTSQALGLRVGYPIGRVMPYLSARVGRGTDDFGAGTEDFDTRGVAIGAEFALNDNLFTNVSVEHAIFDYRDIDLNLRTNAIALGLTYRF